MFLAAVGPAIAATAVEAKPIGDREEIFAAGGDGGGGFGAEDELVGNSMEGVDIADCELSRALVVEAHSVHDSGERAAMALALLHGGGDRAGRVLLVNDFGQFLARWRHRLPLVLLVDFVADAPQDDAGMVAVAADEHAHVLLMPFAKMRP